MSVSVNTSGTLSTSTSEQDLATITSAGVFQAVIDISALNFADAGFIREYYKLTSGGTERLLKEYPIAAYSADAIFITTPRVSPFSLRYSLQQDLGVTRSVPWAIHALASTPVLNTNNTQTTTIGTEHTLATLTTGKTFQLCVDLNPLGGGSSPDELYIREYIKPTSGGTEQIFEEYSISGAMVEKMFISIPRLSAASLKYTLLQYAGTSRNIDWAIHEIA